jgi:hypothetical protein
MSDLVVIAFPTEAKAEEVRQKIAGNAERVLDKACFASKFSPSSLHRATLLRANRDIPVSSMF